jgi:hypothetical protein
MEMAREDIEDGLKRKGQAVRLKTIGLLGQKTRGEGYGEKPER